MSAASAAPVAPASPAKPTYVRRRPETSALYRVVRDNLSTLYAAIEQGFARPLPGFVRDELERFVDCGVLARGIDGGRGGAVTAVQRVSSDLRLNPHFHTLALDGVFAEDDAGELSFHPLPCLTNDDVADLLQIARARIVALLRRKGVIADDSVTADTALADSEPALAELAVASTLGTVPAGPALHRREPVRLHDDRGLEVTKGLL